MRLGLITRDVSCSVDEEEHEDFSTKYNEIALCPMYDRLQVYHWIHAKDQDGVALYHHHYYYYL